MNITTAELKKIILQQLKANPQVESVEGLIVDQLVDSINVQGKLTVKGRDIEFRAELQNSGSGVAVGDADIKAGFFVKAFIRPYLKRVPQLVKSFLEKQYKKKFKSIQITSQGLELK